MPPPPLIAPMPSKVRPELVPLTVMAVAAAAWVSGTAARQNAEPSRAAVARTAACLKPLRRMARTAQPLPDPRPRRSSGRFDHAGMVIGSDGKWSEALKDAFIQASPAGLVKMPPPPAFPALDRAAVAVLNRGAGVAGAAPGRREPDEPGGPFPVA